MPARVGKWLAFKPFSEDSREFTSWMFSNIRLVDDLESLLDKGNPTNVAAVCQQLYTFYKSDDPELKHYVIWLLPSLLLSYFTHCFRGILGAQGRKVGSSPSEVSAKPSGYESLESCLLSICGEAVYNFPLTPHSTKGNYLGLPTLTESSMFHDATLDAKWTTKQTGNFLPTPPVSSRNLSIYNYLCRLYGNSLILTDLLNSNMSNLVMHSIERFCNLATRLASLTSQPRVPVPPCLLIDLLVVLDDVLFHVDEADRRVGVPSRKTGQLRGGSMDAIETIHQRAAFDCMSSVLLLSNAIVNTRWLKRGDVMTVATSSELVPELSRNGVSRSASQEVIAVPSELGTDTLDPSAEEYTRKHTYDTSSMEVFTNASFRPKTVPEDIPVTEHSTSKSKHASKDIRKS